MSGTTRFYRPPEVPWTERRWQKLVALIFLLQLGILFWLDDSVPPPPRTERVSKFSWVLEEPSAAEWEQHILVNDPAQFAFPDPHGFSGQAWMASTGPRLEAREWDEPIRYFDAGQAFARNLTGLRFPDSVPDLHSSILLQNKPWPAIGLTPGAVATAPEIRSLLKVVAPGGQFSLRNLLELPVWKSGDILSNTVVEVSVAPEGHVVAARILSRSGLVAADDWAVGASKRARFNRELGTGGSDQVRLVFQWASGSTNEAATLPPIN